MATRAFGTERTVDRLPDPVPIIEATDRGPVREPDPEPPGVDRPRAEGSIDPEGVSAAAGTPAAVPGPRPKKSHKKGKYGSRKGRPPKDTTGAADTAASARKAATQATLDLNNILFSLHLMGASLLKVPDLALTEEEAKHLAAAITRVTELYEVPLMDEKTRAWFNLGIVGFEVYGTRIVAHMAERKKKQPAPPPMVITPFRPQPQPAPPPPNPIEGFVAPVQNDHPQEEGVM